MHVDKHGRRPIVKCSAPKSERGSPTDQIACYRRLGRLAACSIGNLTQGCAPACPGLLYVAPMGLRECGSAEKQKLRRSFRAEYLQLPDKFGVEYDQRYVFKFVGD